VRLIRADGSTEEYRVEAMDPGQYNMFLDFHDALVHGGPVVASVRQSFENMLVVLRALESAEQGRQVQVVDAGVPPGTGGVPLWRPRGASGPFDGLPSQVGRVPPSRE
jgi:hypothetical protein